MRTIRSPFVLGFLLLLAAPWAAVFAVGPKLDFEDARKEMVDEEIVKAGVKNARVIQSMRDTPRHEFVAPGQREMAYLDMALPIGEGQTISPPFIVAYMTEQIDPQPTDKVLEIGTGSGFQAAVLSPLVDQVYTIEIVQPLGRKAAQVLRKLKYKNVHPKIGDGYKGWPEHAPFDKIIVTCSPEKVPQPLVEQLKEGGRMIVPVGERYQQVLYLYTKKDGKLVSEALRPTLFVPMTGTAEDNRQVLPDPTNPKIVNGGFEELRKEGGPAGWHYSRQLEIVEDSQAPEGKRFARFSNEQAGRGAQALQGMGVDGRKVSALDVSGWVKATGVRQGQIPEHLAAVGIIFYDERRAQVGHAWIGPWRGTFDWREEKGTLKVPAAAREAIIHAGLMGATGEVCFDDLKIEAVRKAGPGPR
ncbi:MAG: protein-L-isoaspartate(D-aspartate) O-methyltransferase [Pirellulales bacterium]